jgi:hypothetical protein
MGNKEARAQMQRCLDGILNSSNEGEQRASWDKLLQECPQVDSISSVLQSPTLEAIRKQKYGLYVQLIMDVR